ncbi:MAG: RNA 2'-phosphotransferase, partial [Desulfobacterales bacterium]|nr:RNA 2'-phosphotransferase [Desulfobacterales bacterium]
SIDEIIDASSKNGFNLDRSIIHEVVAENDKQRFEISFDGLSIRASQGHSIPISLNLNPVSPPEFLFHGTATCFLNSIKCKGLLKGNRNHVHLSADEDTAFKVGKRHGTPAALKIEAKRMAYDGYLFYFSKNKVWLTEHVPEKYIIGL